MKQLDILKLGDNALFGEPAWYELGENFIAHYVNKRFLPDKEIPSTLCNRNHNFLPTHPLLSGELIDDEDPEDEGFMPMCKICLNKLKKENTNLYIPHSI